MTNNEIKEALKDQVLIVLEYARKTLENKQKARQSESEFRRAVGDKELATYNQYHAYGLSEGEQILARLIEAIKAN